MSLGEKLKWEKGCVIVGLMKKKFLLIGLGGFFLLSLGVGGGVWWLKSQEETGNTSTVKEESVDKPESSNLDQEASPASGIEMKEEYENPFDEKTKYSNPFEEEKNPFDYLNE